MLEVYANGASIPALGFATDWMPGNQVLVTLPSALEAGFRHIDTAQIYGNENEVGEALNISGIPREDVFITTKVWVENYRSDHFLRSVEESLAKLRTPYVDMLLLHWPTTEVPLGELMNSLNELREIGKTRHIGVSNFTTSMMVAAGNMSELALATNQIEYHPLLDQSAIIQTAKRMGMAVTANCPIAEKEVLENPLLVNIAALRGKSVPQVVVRWLVQQFDVAALVKIVDEIQAKQILAVFDFTLEAEEMDAINGLTRRNRRFVAPPGLSPSWDR